ncbi:DUF3772 domain-containing protein [Frigidibacter mobilis]|uniref:Mechanosensitive ion channel family protein n=1 Tax=Frigidibacter mobilis TaxID=1335048 RepID=A0A159Z4L8_9RHOB|nr:DUF3772 domain-containing protein [Frigidibacter mobilis]AMY69268.1 mechanosensitive ion channel family protein [Frigidibacter mobilis]
MQISARIGGSLKALALALLLALPVVPGGIGPGAALAQTAEAPDYAAWESVARRAEEAVGAGRASNRAIEDLRAEIVGWRDRFVAAQSGDDLRLDTLRSQLAALGAAPTDGATEAADIAARRAELSAQIAAIQAPRIAAVEAHSRADGIVREIDRLLRERQTQALLTTAPAPLNPANWPAAVSGVHAAFAGIGRDMVVAWASERNRATLTGNLPVIGLYLAAAAILIWRGGGWIAWLTRRLRRSDRPRSRRLAEGAVSFGRILLPVTGTVLISLAFDATGMLGTGGGAGIAALPMLTAPLFIARWLGDWLFPAGPVAPDVAPPLVAPARHAEARVHVTVLGLLLALELCRRVLLADAAPATVAALSFLVQVAAGASLFRLGKLLLAHSRTEATEPEARGTRAQMIGLAGGLTAAVAIVGPLLGGVGYVEAGNVLTWSTTLSLALLGLVLLLQRGATDIYGLVTADERAEEALVPVLAGFGLLLAAMPLLALIWGARLTDLAEVWTRVQTGFDLGGIRLSPAVFLTFGIVFALGYMATRMVQGAMRSTILPKTKLDKGGQTAIVSGLGYVGVFTAAVLAITAAGIDLSSLAIVAGALSVGIGFGLQTIVQNFVSGIILLIERPISEGDWIEVGGQQGIVRAISVRATRIETFDRTDVIVPNADLIANPVTNWTRFNMSGRIIVPVGVAYGSDTRQVERVLLEIVTAHPLVMLTPAPFVLFTGFGESSMDFEIRAVLSDITFGLRVKSDMNHTIAERFAAEGIEIPFPQRDLWLRSSVSMAAGGDAGAKAAVAPATPG